ncbi:Secreted RxLR effector peptide protein [Phytophthora palmivora]|uniref:Secreted RxLR effector peptide protein n=1 Tax=Phytophthora palmivora TaxID=4796 RepID=A0A2P4X009_9STRA|nr:Secreted RxLR effector peptide protein [Phytophthora palmivora]
MRLYYVVLLVAAVVLVKVQRSTSFQLTSADYPSVIIRSFVDHQSGGAPKRLLRRYDEDIEERAIAGGTISGLTTKLKGSVSNLTKKFVDMNKYETQMVTKFNLGGVEDTLTKVGLNQLTDQVKVLNSLNSKNIIKKVSVIGTLTARYGDDSLAKALLTAEKQATDPAWALQIQTLRENQMTRWLKGGNSVDDIFKLLKIRDDGYAILKSRKLEILDDYVKYVNTKSSDQTSLLNTLMKGFGGEEKLWALLQTAKIHGSTMEKAKLMETSLMSKWLSEGQLPANVYQWQKLYKNVNDAFTADNLNKFTKYVDDFNLKDPSNKQSALTLYTNSFGDAAVAKKLVSAMGKPATESVAKKLQTQQLEGWINSKKSVDDMFRTLNIDTEMGVASWQLDVLDKFITRKSGEQSVIKTLTETFGSNSNFATILERASKSTEISALQKKQFAALVDDRNIRPENFMSAVFGKVPTSATEEQKTIAAKFDAFYRSLTSV